MKPGRHPLLAVLVGVSAAAVNAALFAAAGHAGAFGEQVLVRGPGTPITMPPVIVSTLAGIAGGALARLLIGRRVHDRARARAGPAQPATTKGPDGPFQVIESGWSG